GLTIEYASDVMGDAGSCFAAPQSRQFAEERERCFTPDCRKRVSVKEKEGCPAMERFEKIDQFEQGNGYWPLAFPVCFARSSSFRINSMLCSTSFARSSVDADDRLSTPVFDKSGSGL